MTKIVNRINNIKEGDAIIVSIINEGKLIAVVLAKEDNRIKAYDLQEEQK